MMFRSISGPETNPKAPTSQPVTVVRPNADKAISLPSDTAEDSGISPTPSIASDRLQSINGPQRSVEGDRADLSVRHPVVVNEKPGDPLPPLPQGKRWQMVWHDEFDWTTLDGTKWTPSHEMKLKGG
jgi:hypothetical protein